MRDLEGFLPPSPIPSASVSLAPKPRGVASPSSNARLFLTLRALPPPSWAGSGACAPCLLSPRSRGGPGSGRHRPAAPFPRCHTTPPQATLRGCAGGRVGGECGTSRWSGRHGLSPAGRGHLAPDSVLCLSELVRGRLGLLLLPAGAGVPRGWRGDPGVRSRPPTPSGACGILLSQRLVVWVPRERGVGVWISGSEREQRQDKGDGLG